MPNPPLRDNEAATLEMLRELDILDTEAEPEFDVLVEAASRVCNMPMALISLLDENRQWFKAQVGMPDVSQTPRDVAFCAHTVLEQDVFEIPDALQDPRFADNPFVAGSPGIRFYAGAPLSIANGLPIGTLCLMDTLPRRLTAEERKFLKDLATAVVQLIEARLARLRAGASQTALVARGATTAELVIDAMGSVDEAIDQLFERADQGPFGPATGSRTPASAEPAMHFCLTGSSALLRIAHELLHPARYMTPAQRDRVWKQLAADTEIAGQAARRAAHVLAAQQTHRPG